MNLNKVTLILKVATMIIISSLLLSGCGFKPRGSGFETLAGHKVSLFSENPYGPLERIIKKTLRAYSVSVETSGLYRGDSSEDAINIDAIQITEIRTQKVILSVDDSGRPAEYETFINVDVTFFNKDLTIENQQLRQQFSTQRDYRYDKNNTLADDRELEKLVDEMYNTLARRIVSQFSRQLTQR